MVSAACRNTGLDVMFPHDAPGVTRARKICAVCPVRTVCLEYALANQIEHGVWGGTSERERVQIRRERRIALGQKVGPIYGQSWIDELADVLTGALERCDQMALTA